MKIMLIAALWVAITVRAGAETNAAPAPATDEVGEIIRALRTHYVDQDKLDDPTLSAASVAGILNALGQGAVLLTPSAHGTNVTGDVETEVTPVNGNGPVARAEIIEPDIGYLHVTQVTGPTVAAVDAELKKFVDAKVSGYVLDLRYAGGDDYEAATTVASRFLMDGLELFHIKRRGQADQTHRSQSGDGVVRAPDSPLMLLVNGQTGGSAEALVGALRAQDRGIVIGGSLTAGSAMAWEDVPLPDGRVLRVATSKVVLHPADPNGTLVTDVFPGGIAPDIFVPIEATVEREVLFNVATNVTLTVSLQPVTTKKRRSEAELVKAFRGEPLELGFPSAEEAKEDEAGEEIQPVRDVVLQRAVDILKGIRVLLSWQ